MKLKWKKVKSNNWAALVCEMDDALLDALGDDVTLHISGKNKQIKGIFENPYNVSSLPNGGDVLDSEPELFINKSDASMVKRNSFITIASQKWQVIKHPEPDGSGLIKLTLGHSNGQPTERPVIRYRRR